MYTIVGNEDGVMNLTNIYEVRDNWNVLTTVRQTNRMINDLKSWAIFISVRKN